MPKLPTDLASDTLEPLELEQAYRSDPDVFRAWLADALQTNAGSPLLQAWHARLYFQESAPIQPGRNLLLYTILIATLAWALAKLPVYMTVEDEWFYPRFIPWLVVTGLCSWFLLRYEADRTLLARTAGALALALVVLLLLPHDPGSDSITMALIHMPLLLLSLLGFVFGAGRWRDIGQRLAYIRYGGELLIVGTLIMAGGVVLTGLTLGLFGLIGIQLDEWFFEYVVFWGVLSAPLFATLLWDQVLQRQSRMAPMIANVFSPLFLLMTVAYLLALASDQRSPFSDREFLIVFNALLLVVWGITVFSITGRGEQGSRLMDLTNLSLVAVTLVIDAVALAAIVYRTVEFGITPNRVSVTGANLTIFIHLGWILVEYARALRSGGNTDVLRTTIARYLPVYPAWGLCVVVLLPLLFRFT